MFNISDKCCNALLKITFVPKEVSANFSRAKKNIWDTWFQVKELRPIRPKLKQ